MEGHYTNHDGGQTTRKIVISYGMGRKLRCGTNLTERQCQEVIKTIENRILAEKKIANLWTKDIST